MGSWALSGRVATTPNTLVMLTPPPRSLADQPNLAPRGWAHFLSLDVPQPLLEDLLVFLNVSCMHFAAGVKTPPKDWAAPSQHGYEAMPPGTGQNQSLLCPVPSGHPRMNRHVLIKGRTTFSICRLVRSK